MARKVIIHQRHVLYALGKGQRLLVTHNTKSERTVYSLSVSGEEVRSDIVDSLREGGLIRPCDGALFASEEPQSYELARDL